MPAPNSTPQGIVMTLSSLDIVALLLIIVIGLPHGAFDAAIYGLWRGQSKVPTQAHSLALQPLIRFLIAYSAIAACVVIFWLLFPVLALGLFLVISAIHFGLGDSRPPLADRLSLLLSVMVVWRPYGYFLPAEVPRTILQPYQVMARISSQILLPLLAMVDSGGNFLCHYGVAHPSYRWLCFEVICLGVLLVYLPVLPALHFISALSIAAGILCIFSNR